MTETTELPPTSFRPRTLGPASISLVCLFQILTGCCIFFACLRLSPLLAIVGTIVATPAIIRTGLASELYRQSGKQFCWPLRAKCFLESVGVVLLSLALSLTVFALVSCAFGLICVLLSLGLREADLLMEVAFIGTVGGMFWGIAGAILALGYCAKTWKPTEV